MKCLGCVLASIFTVTMLGLVVTHPDWLAATRTFPVGHHRAEARAKAFDPLATDAAARWRHCQPTHWRQCLLQR